MVQSGNSPPTTSKVDHSEQIYIYIIYDVLAPVWRGDRVLRIIEYVLKLASIRGGDKCNKMVYPVLEPVFFGGGQTMDLK